VTRRTLARVAWVAVAAFVAAFGRDMYRTLERLL
jgi:hypothetical protein